MNSLSEHHILVTRPSPQGEALCQQLEAYGAKTYHVPLIEIHARIVNISSFLPDMAIFISVHSVNCCDKNFFDKKISFFSIGATTASALLEYGVISQYPVEGNSEGLLALPDLQDIRGKKIAIFCGMEGRELLQETLKKRGADCQRYEVYERRCPNSQRYILQRIIKSLKLTLVICTSEENLLCLQKLAGSYESQLRQILCVVVSQRLADCARKKGLTRVLAMNTAFTNQSLLEQLLKWRKADVI